MQFNCLSSCGRTHALCNHQHQASLLASMLHRTVAYDNHWHHRQPLQEQVVPRRCCQRLRPAVHVQAASTEEAAQTAATGSHNIQNNGDTLDKPFKPRGTTPQGLERLLATWDRAVSARSYRLLTEIRSPRDASRKPDKRLKQQLHGKRRGLKLEQSAQQDVAATIQGSSSPQTLIAIPSNAEQCQTPAIEPLSASDVQPFSQATSNVQHDLSVNSQLLEPNVPVRPPSRRSLFQHVISVRDVVQFVGGHPPEKLKGHTLDMLVKEAVPVVVHSAMKALGSDHKPSDVQRLFKAMQSTGQLTSYTWASVFEALTDAGQPKAALQLFDKACRDGHDIGPVGASMLIKLCSRARNLDLALDLYLKMTSSKITFNSYTFSCLIHLCALHGRVNDALDILTHMRTEAQSNPSCKPDKHTYGALVRAVGISKRYELLRNIFDAIQEDGVSPEPKVWCALINEAGKAGKPQWADIFFRGYMKRGQPNVGVHNAYLSALCRSHDWDQMVQVFNALPSVGLQPDSYTYVAMLSALARRGASLQEIQSMSMGISIKKIKMNTELGTALLNAYRRTPELQHRMPGQMDTVLEQATDMMQLMVKQRMATNITFCVLACMYIQAGRHPIVPQILQEAEACGCHMDASNYHHLHLVCEDCGLDALSRHMVQLRDRVQKQESDRQRLAQQREEMYRRRQASQPGTGIM